MRYAIPAAVASIPRDRHAVIEASAGTGKTFLIERRVVDLLLKADVGLENILVVTFTEKATAELRMRVRRLLEELLDLREPTAAAGEPHWTIDAGARKLLRRALYAFDAAPIYTIHAFCQRVLTDNAFANRRLFEQEQIDRASALAAAFKTALRGPLACHPALSPYLERWLRNGGWLDQLQKLLAACADARGAFARSFCPDATAAAVRALPAVEPARLLAREPALCTALRFAGLTPRQAEKCVQLAARLGERVARFRDDGDLPRLLAEVETEDAEWLRELVEKLSPTRVERKLTDDDALALRAFGLEAARALVPFSSAIAQVFLPVVLEQLAADKRARGQYDFDDMLGLVWDSLERPGGGELAQTLRERYRFALIDEFQDTDELQWNIFRRLFVDGGRNALCVIGDPKQAIYGFRGADVQTYLRARDEIIAGGGARISLADNWRSSPPLCGAYNELLRNDLGEPLLTGEIRYDEPVTAHADIACVGAAGPAAPVVLMKVASHHGKLDAPALRPVFGRRIARDIRALLDEPAAQLRVGAAEAPRPVEAGDIFVLARSGSETVEMSRYLRDAGVPCALYKQEGLFQTDEANDVLELLRGVARPHDHSDRLKAWQTPFFAVPLDELLHARELPETHPLLERLLDWHQLAARRAYEDLFERIVADSGLVRRELFLRDSERALTNYLHIFELLLEDARSARLDLPELVRRLEAYVEKRRQPAGADGNVQRLESERNAVQIMTMHKAKGLEAAVVFLYGGFTSGGSDMVRVYHRGRERLVHAGPMWDPEAREQHKQEGLEEEQRLLYVALTRGKGRLYLPFFEADDVKGLSGPYKHLLPHLRRAARARDDRFEIVSAPAEPGDDAPASARPLAAWAPPAELLVEPVPSARRARIRHERAGPIITSYTRMKTTAGLEAFAFRAGIDRATAVAEGELPPGSASGVFLHDVLEVLPFSGIHAQRETWCARPEVAALFRAQGLRHRIDAAHLPSAQRMIHRSLTAPVEALGGAAVASCGEGRREVEFVFPLPRAERGFVKGFIDLLFEHDGRVWVLDWKSDALDDYAPEAIARHAREQYDLQTRLYCQALTRMLGIDSAGALDATFGGMMFCFLRGAAFHVARPSWAELSAWARELEAWS